MILRCLNLENDDKFIAIKTNGDSLFIAANRQKSDSVGGLEMKTNKIENEPRLPFVRFDDMEFLMDIDRRQFREAHKQTIIVPFRSQEGREMVKAMQGTEYTMQNHNNQERQDYMLNLYADYLRQKWQAEIERAIDRIKHPRSEWDKSFRKEWHRAKWRRMRGWSRFAKI